MINIAVCDDNKYYIDKIKRTISMLDNAYAEYYSTSNELIKCLENGESFDIYILDISLPDKNGVEISKFIYSLFKNPIIILLSHSDSYVYTAFEVSIFRFILKKYIDTQLLDALIKSIAVISNKSYLKLDYPKINKKIESKNVIYIIKVMKKVEIVLSNNRRIVIRTTLKELYQRLDKELFIYINQGVIINMSNIRNIRGNEIRMSNDEILYTSRELKKEVKDLFINYLEAINYLY